MIAYWTALAVEMTRLDGLHTTVMTFVMVECYMRPGEITSLTSSSCLAPTSKAERGIEKSMVGLADDTLPVDSDRWPWLEHFFRVLLSLVSGLPHPEHVLRELLLFRWPYRTMAWASSGAPSDCAQQLGSLKAMAKRK